MKSKRKTRIKTWVKYLAALLLGVAGGIIFYKAMQFGGASFKSGRPYYFGILAAAAIVFGVFAGRRQKERIVLTLVSLLSGATMPYIIFFFGWLHRTP